MISCQLITTGTYVPIDTVESGLGVTVLTTP